MGASPANQNISAKAGSDLILRRPWVSRSVLERLGQKEWQREVEFAVAQLKKSLIADYLVLGGGNTKRLDSLPEGVERGHNRNAFLGGTRLWQTETNTRRPKWRIL